MKQSDVYEINVLFDDLKYLWKIEEILERGEYLKDITIRFKEDTEYVFGGRIIFEEKIDFTERSVIDKGEILKILKEIIQKKLEALKARFERLKLIRE